MARIKWHNFDRNAWHNLKRNGWHNFDRFTYKPAYGYKKEEKKLVIHEQEAIIIKDIFTKYAKGESVKQLVQYLNLKNVPTRNSDFMIKDDFRVNNTKTINKSDIKWSKSSLRNILRNTVYCGYKFYNGGTKINTPAIITEELFTKCQDEIKGRTTNTDRTLTNDFMLRGILKCGECGNYFLGTRSHSNLLYKCSDKTHIKSNSYTGCKNTSIFKEHVESMIWNAVKGAYIQLRTKQIKEGNITTLNNSIEEYTVQIESIEAELNNLVNESGRMIKLYSKGLFSDDLLETEQKRINSESDSLNRTKKKLQALKVDSINTLEAVQAIDNNPFDLVEVEKSYELQKIAVKELLKEVFIYKINNKYSMFLVNFKADYSFYIIRETWTKKYHVLDGNLFSFNSDNRIFTTSGMVGTSTFSFDSVDINYEPIELFNEMERQNKITELVTNE